LYPPVKKPRVARTAGASTSSRAKSTRLVDFVADGHGTAAVAEKLRGLERAASAQRSKVTVLERPAQTSWLPSPDELMGIVFALEKRVSADTTQAREELRRIFRAAWRLLRGPQSCRSSYSLSRPRRFFE
jgi:hypothetical protein